MKQRILIYLSAALTAASCHQDDFVVDCEPFQQYINVCAKAGVETEGPDSKVDVSGLSLTWNANDEIGIFAGPNNFNRRFTLKDGAGSHNATFTGELLPTNGRQTLIAYYPYDSNLTDPSDWHLDYEGQTYNGNFSESGTGTDIEHYLYMATFPTDGFQIETGSGWPSGYTLNFNRHLSSIVRFKISNDMSSDIVIDKIQLYSPMSPFYDLYADLPESRIIGYWNDIIGVSLDSPLTMRANNASGNKYVHMAASRSNFGNGTDLEVRIFGTLDGQNVRMSIPKRVSSNANLTVGKRTTVNVQLNDRTSYEIANTVDVVLSGNRLVSPEFEKSDADWQPGRIIWGDGKNEQYAGGISHQYYGSSSYTASFSCWGTSSTVKFSNLENITSIDFSNF